MTSYYDSLGLLAICDAIETVEGVPLSALPPAGSEKARARQRTWSTPIKQGSQQPSAESSSPPNMKTPNSDQKPSNAEANNNNKAHQHMTPRSGESVDSARVSGLPYAYPPVTPLKETTNVPKSRKMSLPSLPVYHHSPDGTVGAAAGDGSAPHRSYPLLYAQSISYPHTNIGADGPQNLKKDEEAVQPIGFSHLSAQLAVTGKQYAVAKSRRDSKGRKLSTAMVDMPGMVLDMKMSHMSIKNSTSPSPASPLATSGSSTPKGNTTTSAAVPLGPGVEVSRPPLMVGGFKVEECHICGRNFKGPKASTHKQQHIRRLHPEDYTPKRGGKKRVVVIDAATTAAATATAVAAMGAGGNGGNIVSLSTSSPY